MKIKKRVQKLIALALALITLSNCVAVAFASGENPADQIGVNLNRLMQPLEACVSVNEDGIFEIDNVAFSEALEITGNALLAVIREEAGIVTIDDLHNAITEGVASVNASITNEDLVFVDSDTLVDASDDSYYLQGGSTYSTVHWWGVTHYKSTTAANTWVRKLCQAANMGGMMGAIVGTTFGVWCGLAITITSSYLNRLATDVSYYNSTSPNGIVAKIYWILAYKIRAQ